jgi:hypothetical protein
VTNFAGIAAVTQTLAYLAANAINVGVPEASVTTMRPEAPAAGAADEPRLNIYLVQVAANPVLRSNDLPTRNANGDLISTPQAALDLRYLFSYFGPSTKAQLMLGAIEVAMRERAELDATTVGQALAPYPELHGTGLEFQRPPVRIIPSTTTLEELSRFWSGFFQMPYTLSTMHEASPVMLSSALPTTAALPVQRPAAPAGPPAPQLDPLPAVTFSPGLSVPVSGSGLQAGQLLGLGPRPEWLKIAPDADGRLAFTLPGDIGAGVLTAVLGGATAGQPPAPIAGSAPQSLSIRPNLTSVTLDSGDALLWADVEPDVLLGQHLALSLVSTAPAQSGAASTRLAKIATDAGPTIAFPAPDLPAGPYLAMIEVDGVASVPTYEGDRYVAPEVQLG